MAELTIYPLLCHTKVTTPLELEGRFVHLTAEQMQDFEVSGTLQMLDDCGPSLTFQKGDTYNEARIVLHKDRVLRHIVIPYTQTRSSRSYSWYQRLDALQ